MKPAFGEKGPNFGTVGPRRPPEVVRSSPGKLIEWARTKEARRVVHDSNIYVCDSQRSTGTKMEIVIGLDGGF